MIKSGALRFFAVVFLLSAFGAAAEGPARAADGRDVRLSQWRAAGDAPARVGNFSVARPDGETLLAGWRRAAWARALDDVKNALPADNAADWLRLSAREKWLYNRDLKTLSAWWRDVNWQSIGLNLLQRTADFGAGEWLSALEHSAGGSAFVRALEVDFTPALGERRWQLGLNAVGGFRETDDDVLAWQLRAYGSQKNSRGGNIGLIYRYIPQAADGLAGVNVFFDYEHHGGYEEWFTRWSLGAEYRAAWGGLDANWYFPLRDSVERDDAYIYSRRGWDARLLLAGPAAWLDGALTYYHWRGRFGDGNDTGLRYGLRFSPPQAPGWRLDVEYDTGDKARQWSGRLSWLYRINEARVAAPAARSAAAFDARENFYNPVRREHGQRIRLVEKAENWADAAGLFVTITAVRGEGVGGALGLTLSAPGLPPAPLALSLAPPALSLTALALAGVQLTGARVTAGGAEVLYPLRATATIFSAAGSTLSVATGGAAPWSLLLGENTGVEFSDGGRQLYVLTGTVHFQREGAGVERIKTPGAMLRLLGTTLNVGWDGNYSHVTVQRGVASLSFLAERPPLPSDFVITILRATLRQSLLDTTLPGGSVAADPAPATVSIRYHSTALRGIVPDKAVATLLIPPRPGIRVSLLNAVPPLVLAAAQTGVIATVTATGGNPPLRYRLAAGSAPVLVTAGGEVLLSLATALGAPRDVAVTIFADDANEPPNSGEYGFGLLTYADVAADGVTATVAATVTGPVGTISAQGGDGAYAYALNADDAELELATAARGDGRVGVLRLASPLGASRPLEATVIVTDGIGGRTEAPVRIVSRSLPSLDGGLRMLGATQSGAVYTLQATGGDGAYSYALAAGTNARVSLSSSDTDADGTLNAVLSLTAGLGADVALEVEVRVTDGDGLSDSAVVTLSTYAALAAAGFSVEVASDDTGEVSIIAADGGDGVYAFALNADNAALALRTEERGGENVGVVVLNSALGASQTAEATVTVTDGVGGTVEALVTISSRSLPSLPGGARTLGATQSGNVFTLTATGGDETYTYALAAGTDARVSLAESDTDGDGKDNAVLSLTAELGDGVALNVQVSVTDGDGLSASGIVTLSAHAGLLAEGVTTTVAADDIGPVGTISAQGGGGAYTYALNNAALALATETSGGINVGVLRLVSTLGASQVLEATVTVTDEVGGRIEAPVRIVSRALPSLDGGLRELGATQSGAVYTLQATGGDGVYSYALATGTDARVSLSSSDTDSDGTLNAVLSLTAGLGGDVVLQVEVRVTDGDGLSDSGIVTLSTYAALAAAGFSVEVASDDTGEVSIIAADGGDGDYSFVLHADNAALALRTEERGGENVGVVVLNSALGASQTAEATVTVTDGVGGEVEALVTISSRSLPSLPGGARTLGATQSGNVFTLTATGGDETYTYALAAGTDARVSLAASDTDGDGKDNAILSLTAALGDGVALEVEVTVTDGDNLSASGIVTLSAYAGLLAEGVTATVAADDTGPVGTISAQGGGGAYTYALNSDNAALALATETSGGVNVGVLRLASALGASQVLEATVTVTDEVGGRIETPVRISSRSLPELDGGLRELGATQSGDVFTLTATGGDEEYTYALATGADARVELAARATDGDSAINAVLSLPAALGGDAVLLVTVSVTDGDGLSDTGIVTLSTHAALAAAGFSAEVASDDTGEVSIVAADGGDGDYSFALHADNAALALRTEERGGENVGVVVLNSALGASQTAEATVTVTDGVGGSMEALVTISSRSLPSLPGGARTLGATQSGNVFTLTATGGDETYTYSLATGTDARVSLAASDTDGDGKDNAVLSLTAELGDGVALQVEVSVTDGDGLSASGIVTLSAYAGLLADGVTATVAADDTGAVGTINAQGGGGAYTYALNTDNAALALATETSGGANVGALRLASALGASQTLEATVTVTDEVGGRIEAPVRIVSRALPSLDGGLRELGATQSGEVYTLQAAGGDGAYTYALAAGTNASVALSARDTDGDGADNAVLSLPAALGGDVALEVEVSVTDGDSLSDSAVVTLSTYAALAAAGFSATVASDATGEVSIIAADGGDGVYAFALNSDNTALALRTEERGGENVGVVVLNSALGASQTAEATVTVTDGVGGTVEAVVTLSSYAALAAAGFSAEVAFDATGEVSIIAADGGDGVYAFALNSDNAALALRTEERGGENVGVVVLNSALGASQTAEATVTVTDGVGGTVEAVVTLSSYAALAAAGFSVEVASDDTGEAGVISADGGDGVYTFALNADNAALALRTEERGGENVGVVVLNSALGASQTAEATVTVSDGVGGEVEALVTISSRSLPLLPGGLRELGATQSGEVYTLTATGGDETYTYALAIGTDARVSLAASDTDGDGKDNAVLSLTAELGDGVALQVEVSVTDGDGLSASGIVTLSAHAGLLAEGVTATVAADDTGEVGVIAAAGGDGSYSYALNTENAALALATEARGGANAGVLRLATTLGASQTLEATVTVTDEVGGRVEAPVRIVSRSLPSLDGGLRMLGATESGAVFTLQAAGGDADYSYTLAAGTDARAALAQEDAGGGLRRAVLSLPDALGGEVVLLVTVSVTDGDSLSDSGIVTLSSYAALAASGFSVEVASDDTGEAGVIAADGGDGVYTFALHADNAALALRTEERGGENVGVVVLDSALGASQTAEATVTVTDGVGGTVEATVTISSRSLPVLDGGDVTLGATESGAVFTLQATGGDEDYSYTLAAGTDARAALAQEDAGGGLRRAVLSLPAALGGEVVLLVTVSVTDGDGLSDAATVTLSSYAALAAAGFSVEVASDDTGEAGVIAADGGDGVYTFALHADNAALALRTEERGGENVGVVVLDSALGASQTATATVTVTDGVGGEVEALVTISSRSLPVLDGGLRALGATESGAVFTLQAAGGDEDYSYTLAAGTDARAALAQEDAGGGLRRAVLSLPAALGGEVVLLVTIGVTDGDELSDAATVTLSTYAALAASGFSVEVASDDTGEAGVISADGGDGVYAFALHADNAALALRTEERGGENVGVVVLDSALGASQTAEATVTVTDGVSGTVEVLVTVSSRSLPELGGGLRRLGSTESGAMFTLQAAGGDGAYTYSLAADSDARIALAEEDAGGGLRRAVLSLTDALGGEVVLLVTVSVTDGDELSDSGVVTLSSYAALAAAGFSVEIASDDTGAVGVIAPAGGDGVYTYSLNADNATLTLATVAGNAELRLTAALGAEQILTATVTVTDGVSGEMEATITVTTRSLPVLDGGVVTLGASQSGAVYTLQATGGDETYTYSLAADSDARAALAQEDAGGGLRRAVLSLPAALGGEVLLPVTISVTDGDDISDTGIVTLTTYATLSASGVTVTIGASIFGATATLSASGADGVFAYSLNADNDALTLVPATDADGANIAILSVTAGLGESLAISATAIITDGVFGRRAVPVLVTTRRNPALFADELEIVTGGHQTGRIDRAVASHGDGNYRYHIKAGHDARFALSAAVVGARPGYHLDVTAPLGDDNVFLLTVVVTDGDGATAEGRYRVTTYPPLDLGEDETVVIPPELDGVAHVVPAAGGNGRYSFREVSGDDRIEVFTRLDGNSAGLRLAAPLGENQTAAVEIEVTDSIGTTPDTKLVTLVTYTRLTAAGVTMTIGADTAGMIAPLPVSGGDLKYHFSLLETDDERLTLAVTAGEDGVPAAYVSVTAPLGGERRVQARALVRDERSDGQYTPHIRIETREALTIPPGRLVTLGATQAGTVVYRGAASGGDGDYAYSLNTDDARLVLVLPRTPDNDTDDALLSVSAGLGGEILLTATLTARDGGGRDGHYSAAQALMTISTQAALRADGVTLTISGLKVGALATITPAGGEGDYSYALISEERNLRIDDGGVLMANPPLLYERLISATVVVTDDFVAVSAPVLISTYPALSLGPDRRVTIRHDALNIGLTLTASGGVGDYTYKLQDAAHAGSVSVVTRANDARGGVKEGVVVLLATLGYSRVFAPGFVVTDGEDRNSAAQVRFTTYASLRADGVTATVDWDETGIVGTITATGGNGVYAYALNADNDALEMNGEGVLSLTAALGDSGFLTATVTVSDGVGYVEEAAVSITAGQIPPVALPNGTVSVRADFSGEAATVQAIAGDGDYTYGEFNPNLNVSLIQGDANGDGLRDVVLSLRAPLAGESITPVLLQVRDGTGNMAEAVWQISAYANLRASGVTATIAAAHAGVVGAVAPAGGHGVYAYALHTDNPTLEVVTQESGGVNIAVLSLAATLGGQQVLEATLTVTDSVGHTVTAPVSLTTWIANPVALQAPEVVRVRADFTGAAATIQATEGNDEYHYLPFDDSLVDPRISLISGDANEDGISDVVLSLTAPLPGEDTAQARILVVDTSGTTADDIVLISAYATLSLEADITATYSSPDDLSFTMQAFGGKRDSYVYSLEPRPASMQLSQPDTDGDGALNAVVTVEVADPVRNIIRSLSRTATVYVRDGTGAEDSRVVVISLSRPPVGGLDLPLQLRVDPHPSVYVAGTNGQADSLVLRARGNPNILTLQATGGRQLIDGGYRYTYSMEDKPDSVDFRVEDVNGDGRLDMILFLNSRGQTSVSGGFSELRYILKVAVRSALSDQVARRQINVFCGRQCYTEN